MKKVNRKFAVMRALAGMVRQDEIKERLRWASAHAEAEVFERFATRQNGLDAQGVELAKEKYGSNIVSQGKKNAAVKRFFSAFISPFTAILLALAVISAFTDIVFAAPGERNYVTVIIIATMVFLSGALRFIQETRSGNVVERLSGMLHTTACVLRAGARMEISMDEIVVGDIVYLSAGDMIPADLRILEAKDLFVSQSALTGESEPVEKLGVVLDKGEATAEAQNLAFMGSNVVSGSARAIALAVGDDTMLGGMAKELEEKPVKTAFEKGIGDVSKVLIRFMLLMAPVVLFINGFTKGDWMQALLFAISVAVGLTPEMLPMIVTTSLAKGALAMSKNKVVIKNLNSIQNLGSMDVLCTDKTGTLTQDRVVLEYHLNIDGEEDDRVLRHAFLNSYFQTGLKNLIDVAVISRQEEKGAEALIHRYTKVDEIPFDFERRRMSVVVMDTDGKTQMVTKGAVEEMLKCCAYAECGGAIQPLGEDVRRLVLEKSAQMNEQGMRVNAVAQKTDPAPVGEFSAADEKDYICVTDSVED